MGEVCAGIEVPIGSVKWSVPKALEYFCGEQVNEVVELYYRGRILHNGGAQVLLFLLAIHYLFHHFRIIRMES